jgi:hypothetical protein
MSKMAFLRKDWGPYHADNTYGIGGACLYNYAPKTIWVARENGNQYGFRYRPAYYMEHAHTWAEPGARLVIFPGGVYPEEPLVMTKPLYVKSVGYNAYLGTD